MAGAELTSLWARVGGLRVHALAAAHPPPSSPVVVLVHGIVISSRYMVPTAELLAPLCRVYAVDLPGYGRSDKPPRVLCVPELARALADWIEVIGLSRVTCVGNSYGCQIIVELGVRRPELVERAVLQGPTIDPAARTFAQQLWRSIRNTPNEAFGLGPLTIRDYLTAGLLRAARTIRCALEDPIEDKLPAFDVPTLVVRGTKDPIVPQRWAEEVVRLLPHGTLALVDGGHTLNYSAAERFVRAIAPFLGLGGFAGATER